MIKEDWTIQDRIQYIIDHYFKQSPTALAKKANINRTTLNAILGPQGSVPGYEVIRKLVSMEYPKINLNWLILGEGDMEVQEDQSSHHIQSGDNNQLLDGNAIRYLKGDNSQLVGDNSVNNGKTSDQTSGLTIEPNSSSEPNPELLTQFLECLKQLNERETKRDEREAKLDDKVDRRDRRIEDLEKKIEDRDATIYALKEQILDLKSQLLRQSPSS